MTDSEDELDTKERERVQRGLAALDNPRGELAKSRRRDLSLRSGER